MSDPEAAAYHAAVYGTSGKQQTYVQARAVSKDRGTEVRDAQRQMNRLAASVIATVRAKAEISEDPAAVYALANIAPRQAATPAGPPPQPLRVVCSLGTDGVNTVTWRGSPSNTAFTVQRQLTLADGTVTGYRPFGGAAVRPLRDATIPAGTLVASYRVQALRNGKPSAWSEPGVLTLVPNGGTEETELRLAA